MWSEVEKKFVNGGVLARSDLIEVLLSLSADASCFMIKQVLLAKFSEFLTKLSDPSLSLEISH